MASSVTWAMRRLATSPTRLSTLRMPTMSRCLRVDRCYSTEQDSAPPPLLSKLKADIKKDMRERNAPRLAVLRTILAATINASKTEKPVTTDMHLISIMHKTARNNQEALDDAKAANRQDLVEKEGHQLRIIQEYIASTSVPEPDEEELKAHIKQVIESCSGEGPGGGKKKMMSELMRKDWAAEGKYVNKATLAKLLEEALKVEELKA